MASTSWNAGIFKEDEKCINVLGVLADRVVDALSSIHAEACKTGTPMQSFVAGLKCLPLMNFSMLTEDVDKCEQQMYNFSDAYRYLVISYIREMFKDDFPHTITMSIPPIRDFIRLVYEALAEHPEPPQFHWTSSADVQKSITAACVRKALQEIVKSGMSDDPYEDYNPLTGPCTSVSRAPTIVSTPVGRGGLLTRENLESMAQANPRSREPPTSNQRKSSKGENLPSERGTKDKSGGRGRNSNERGNNNEREKNKRDATDESGHRNSTKCGEKDERGDWSSSNTRRGANDERSDWGSSSTKRGKKDERGNWGSSTGRGKHDSNASEHGQTTKVDDDNAMKKTSIPMPPTVVVAPSVISVDLPSVSSRH